MLVIGVLDLLDNAQAHVCGKQSVWHLNFKLVPTRLLWEATDSDLVPCDGLRVKTVTLFIGNCESTGFQWKLRKVRYLFMLSLSFN